MIPKMTMPRLFVVIFDNSKRHIFLKMGGACIPFLPFLITLKFLMCQIAFFDKKRGIPKHTSAYF